MAVFLTACSTGAELAVPDTASNRPSATTSAPADTAAIVTAIPVGTPSSQDLPPVTSPPSTEWSPLTGQSRVLLIGDSISIGYTPFVAEDLGDDGPLVVRNDGNAQSTDHALSSNRIHRWIGAGNWDVIYFNFGLHDLAWADANQSEVPVGTVGAGPRVSLERYEAQLQEIIDILRPTNARLIFATTTPVYATAGSRYVGSELAYNEIAVSVMQRNGIEISDLHSFALANIRVNQLVGGSDNIHFNASGYELLATAVVAALENPPGS